MLPWEELPRRPLCSDFIAFLLKIHWIRKQINLALVPRSDRVRERQAGNNHWFSMGKNNYLFESLCFLEKDPIPFIVWEGPRPLSIGETTLQIPTCIKTFLRTENQTIIWQRLWNFSMSRVDRMVTRHVEPSVIHSAFPTSAYDSRWARETPRGSSCHDRARWVKNSSAASWLN